MREAIEKLRARLRGTTRLSAMRIAMPRRCMRERRGAAAHIAAAQPADDGRPRCPRNTSTPMRTPAHRITTRLTTGAAAPYYTYSSHHVNPYGYSYSVGFLRRSEHHCIAYLSFGASPSSLVRSRLHSRHQDARGSWGGSIAGAGRRVSGTGAHEWSNGFRSGTASAAAMASEQRGHHGTITNV